MKPKSARIFTEGHRDLVETMLHDELLTDVTLHCRDGTVKAHKVVLAACSSYFRRVFIENVQKDTVFLMYNLSVNQMRNLLQLIYKGSIELAGEDVGPIYGIANDLKIRNVFVEEGCLRSSSTSSGRDTRFKGQKRVVVDFKEFDDTDSITKMSKSSMERRLSSTSEKSTEKENLIYPILNEVMSGHTETGKSSSESDNTFDNKERLRNAKKRTAWFLKQRSFKCNECPASFKRASHLSRHQLVHTGERPYACDQCDKAFSRPDKLKHHVRKFHEDGDTDMNMDSLYTIGHVEVLNMGGEDIDTSTPIKREDLIQHTKVTNSSSSVKYTPLTSSVPQKKRGRPRKYPPVPPPLVKRPRGRPRIHPLPQSTYVPVQQKKPTTNYDITNMPFGDLSYLTQSLHQGNQSIMEPLVEIKTEPNDEKPEEGSMEQEGKDMSQASTFLETIGLLENKSVGKIGDCTISVAPN